MSYRIYHDAMYNKCQKEIYLKTVSNNSNYYRTLSRASSLEEEYGKDLYNFNIIEIEQLLSFLNPKTINSCQSATSTIQSYINWAIEQGLRTDNTSPLDAMVDKKFFKRFIDQTNVLLFSKEDMDNITGVLANRIDAAVVQCLFEGLMGKKYSELLNLTIHDIKEDENILVLKNDISETESTKRILRLEEDSLLPRLLIKTFDQKSYYKNNGNPSPTSRSTEVPLIENDYIFRAAAMGVKYYGKADSHLVLRKLKLISDWVRQPYLSAVNVRNSGMLYELYRLYMSHGKIEKEEYDIIGEKFNISKTKEGFYNLAKQKNEFLNMETMREIYMF